MGNSMAFQDKRMNQLHLRLQNCIQTILDLEPGLRNSGLQIFDSDFLSLREFLSHIEQIQVKEEDVRRLEDVTVHFLKEIGRGSSWASNCTLLQ